MLKLLELNGEKVMLMVRQVVLFSLTIFAANQINAEPTIVGSSGELIDGQTITITGGNFSKAEAVPLVWDSVDNQNEETITDKAIIPTGTGHTWGDNGSPWAEQMIFDKETHKPGRFTSYSGKTKGYIKWPTAIKDKKLNNIFVSWWFKPSESANARGGSNKFIRIWDDTDGKGTRISWTSMHLTTREITSWADWGGKAGEWNRLDIWVSDDTGKLRAWMNNKLMHSSDLFVKDKEVDKGLNVYLLGFDASHPERYPDLDFNVSDIYISPTIARVELSNKANWEDINAIREIQPIQSWKDNEITFSLNSGSFNSMTGKYLYVVDSTGNVNTAGFPLCEKCPQPPVLDIE